jgi:hypothetical protein
MKKSLFLVTLLTFSSLIFAANKSYSVTFAAASKVGGTQLAKGDYKMQVEGDKIVFTDKHLKTISVPMKIETGTGKKFEFTSVEATQKEGSEIVKAIHLGGSNTTIEFSDSNPNAN